MAEMGHDQSFGMSARCPVCHSMINFAVADNGPRERALAGRKCLTRPFATSAATAA
jgi:hypothetical protein